MKPDIEDRSLTAHQLGILQPVEYSRTTEFTEAFEIGVTDVKSIPGVGAKYDAAFDLARDTVEGETWWPIRRLRSRSMAPCQRG